MRLIGMSGASAANAPSRLLGMTCMASIDGSIPLLAAQGALADPLSAASIGLTMVAGIGAWITAWQAFPKRPGARGIAQLAALGIINLLVTMAAAAIGAHIGDHLVVLPKAIGLVILLIAAEVAGLRLPRLGGLGAPSLAVLGAISLEVLLWIP